MTKKIAINAGVFLSSLLTTVTALHPRIASAWAAGVFVRQSAINCQPADPVNQSVSGAHRIGGTVGTLSGSGSGGNGAYVDSGVVQTRLLCPIQDDNSHPSSTISHIQVAGTDSSIDGSAHVRVCVGRWNTDVWDNCGTWQYTSSATCGTSSNDSYTGNYLCTLSSTGEMSALTTFTDGYPYLVVDNIGSMGSSSNWVDIRGYSAD